VIVRELKATDASSKLSVSMCLPQSLCKGVSPMSDPDILIKNAKGKIPPEPADLNYCVLNGQSLSVLSVALEKCDEGRKG